MKKADSMDLRERSTQSTSTGGYWFRTSEAPGTKHFRASNTDLYKTCLDFTHKTIRKEPPALAGMLPPSDFELREIWRVPCRMNRSGSGLNLVQAVIDYTGDANVRTTLYKERGSVARQAENNLYSIELMARTNPFRTDYSIPVAIAELADVSSLFRFAGKTFSEFVGGSFLNYQFGWLQFVRDLKDIQSAVDLIKSRVREFESLGKHGGVRRKIWLDQKTLQQITAAKTVQSTLISVPPTGKARCELNAKIKVYGTIRWIPKTSFRDVLERLDLTALSVKQIFDLGERTGDTVWNMIPMSWIIDYFFAVSDFLSALRGQDFIEPKDLCILREYTHSERILPDGSTFGSVGVSNGFCNVTIKARDVWVPVNVPPFQVRLLSKTQLTILGALVATFVGRIR